jgi:hypothetical protein
MTAKVLQFEGENRSPENKVNFSLDPYCLNAVENLAAVGFPESL